MNGVVTLKYNRHYGKDNIPDYVITNYRLVKDLDDAKYADEYDLFYQIRVDNALILSVVRRKPA